jgi:hypothetical protein
MLGTAKRAVELQVHGWYVGVEPGSQTAGLTIAEPPNMCRFSPSAASHWRLARCLAPRRFPRRMWYPDTLYEPCCC